MSQKDITKLITRLGILAIVIISGYGIFNGIKNGRGLFLTYETSSMNPLDVYNKFNQLSAPQQEIWIKSMNNKKISWIGKIYSINQFGDEGGGKYAIYIRFEDKDLGSLMPDELEADTDLEFSADEAAKFSEGQEVSFSGVITDCGFNNFDAYGAGANTFVINLDNCKIR
jgi:hypothetical protein